jgi:aspartate racemase
LFGRNDLKTIGLLGGMSWESSAEYYQIINETIAKRLGGNHSARCLMYSFDFAEIEELQKAGDWKQATVSMIEAARSLEKGGAEFLVICTNTMHKMADEVQQSIQIPLLHIVDAVADQVMQQKHRRIGLLGTMFTMEEAFYKERLSNRYKLEVLIPEKGDRQIVHRIIHDELVSGKILSSSRDEYKRIIASLVVKGAEAIILGCTEIGLLIKNNDSAVPLFDTTKIHALAAVEYALQTEG